MLAGMDPNLFHLDWDRTGEVLVGIILLSLFVERALAILFENRWFLENQDKPGQKETLAFVVALIVCLVWDFDAISMVILADQTNWFGALVTAGIVAGGSKGSIKLFRDVMGWKSSAREQLEAARKADAAAAAKPQPAEQPEESEEPQEEVEAEPAPEQKPKAGKKKPKKKKTGKKTKKKAGK